MERTPLEPWILDKIEMKKEKNISKEKLREYIEKYQIKKLKENIDYVKKNSIFYKAYLKNIFPEEINSFKSFEKVPFTNPEHIKDNPLSFLCVSQRHISRIVSLNTSGTGGTSKRIYFTEEDQELTIDFFEKGMRGLVKEKDVVLILLPGDAPSSVGDLLKRGLSRINVEAYIYGIITDYYKVAQIIEEKNINCIVGIPIQVLNLKRKYNNTFDKYIKKILLSTDYVPQTVIKELSFKGCMVFTHYGMTEMGLGGGVECEALNGYHMREADLYFEVINPKTKEVVEDGAYGEIVCTTLTRKGMPLIRYRTGDIGRFIKEPCTCGTALKTMERVLGRFENTVSIFEDKYLSMKELDEALLEREEILNYKAYIDENREKECFSIIIQLQISKYMFENIKEDVYKKLCEISGINEALKRKKAELIIKHDEENIESKNGTYKRKIHDYRRI